MEKIKRKRWTQEECDILKQCVEKDGWVTGSSRAAKLLNRTYYSCVDKAHKLQLKGNKTILRGDSKDVKKVLKKYISENPNNLTEAFRKTAEECGMTTGTVANRWYGINYKEAWKDTIGTCFMTVGKNYTVNSKNTNENKKTSVWAKIKKLFKLK